MVNELFEKLINVRLVDYLVKCGLFSDFHYSFRSSRSTEDLLTVVSDRTRGLLVGLGLLEVKYLI